MKRPTETSPSELHSGDQRAPLAQRPPREAPGAATATLAAALDDAGARDRLRRKGWELVDGRGRSRVVESLLDTGEAVSG